VDYAPKQVLIPLQFGGTFRRRPWTGQEDQIGDCTEQGQFLSPQKLSFPLNRYSIYFFYNNLIINTFFYWN